MQTKKPKSLKKLESTTSTTKKSEFLYSDDVLQSAIKKGARKHPPLYECKNCSLQFKNLASFAPHNKYLNDYTKCQTRSQILTTGAFQEITYYDDFLFKKHTCIAINPIYVSNPNTENINRLADKFDIDRINKHYDPNDYEYITDTEQIGKRLQKYGVAAELYVPKPPPVKQSFETMVENWIANTQSSALDLTNISNSKG